MNERPACDAIILEGENIIASSPSNPRTLKQHVKSLFDFKVKPNFLFCDQVFLMFDDAYEQNIKLTGQFRYDETIPYITLSDDYLIEDYSHLFKNRKTQLKKQF